MVAAAKPSVVEDDYAIRLLQRMIQHKSYTRSDGEREIVAWMAEELEGLGLETELVPVDGNRANVVGHWRGSGGGRSLLFNGHVDTNPVTEGWTVDPWAGKVDSKFVYGIGVSNMKAGDAAYFCAVKRLMEQGFRPKGDVILTYVVGELQGGIGTKALIDHGLRADYFVNCEPTDLQALTMHAASFYFVIELVGETRHLSKREDAVDALTAASRLLPLLNAMTFRGALSKDHAAINRVHVGVMHGALGRDLHEWRPGQVSDFVRLRGSGRYAPGQTEDGCLADIRNVIQSVQDEFPGLEASLVPEQQNGRITMPAFEVAADNPIVRAINDAHIKVRGRPQKSGVIFPPSFYGTDAGHLHKAGRMSGVVCGPGGRYNTMPDERVDIEDYLDSIRIYSDVIVSICGEG